MILSWAIRVHTAILTTAYNFRIKYKKSISSHWIRHLLNTLRTYKLVKYSEIPWSDSETISTLYLLIIFEKRPKLTHPVTTNHENPSPGHEIWNVTDRKCVYNSDDYRAVLKSDLMKNSTNEEINEYMNKDLKIYNQVIMDIDKHQQPINSRYKRYTTIII